MRAILVLGLLVLAGCVQTTPEPQENQGNDGHVDFSFSPEAPVAGEKVTFTALKSLPNSTSVEAWHWNFGDGGEMEGSLLRYTYAYGGNYDVQLTANLTDGTTRTASKTISVSGDPAPEGGEPGTGEPGEPGDPGEPGEPGGEVVNVPRDWPDPLESHVRPGDYHSPDGCTLNFIYQYGERFFFGSAGHCMSGGPDDDGEIWNCGDGDYSAPIGTTTTVGEHGLTLTLAYSAWETMHRVGEADSNLCRGNDFILLEIAAKDLDKVHPAVHRYGGPTGLGSIDDYSPGDGLRAYGRSSLHDDTILYGEDSSLTNPKTGVFLGQNNGGWSYNVYLVVPGIPGDSGGGLMDDTGLALGAASTISYAGGSNNYANIEKALEYMELREGWAPTLVTWDDFDPNPRLP